AGASDPGEDLLLAAEKGDAARVRALLASGADVNARDDRSRSKHSTPLLLAVRGGHADAARALLDGGADPALDDAGSEKDRKLARMMFSQTDPESIRELGLTLGRAPLAEAAARGDLDLVGELLARGASVDQVDYFGVTPLMLAARRGHTAVLRRLLAAGANVNHRNQFGDSPLTEAAKLGVSASEWETLRETNDPRLYQRAELCRVLLDAGADVNNVTDSGFTALTVAVLSHNDPLARLLLDRGASAAVGTVAGE